MEPKESSVASAMPLPAAPQPVSPLGAVNTASSPSVNASGTPAQAQDVDVIEPAWVAAVQHVMNRYRHDPFELAKAMTALRQDYLMKRYNKRVGSVD